MNEPARVMVVDDHPIIRQGLAMLINRESDLRVCCEAGSVAEASALLAQCQPQVAIVDISMDGASGFELLRHIRLQYPDLPVLVVSMHDEALYAERALQAGARGYVMKQEATDKVLLALRAILAGEIFVNERIAARLQQRASMPANAPDGPQDMVSLLTTSEFEILQMIANGHDTSEIAKQLNRSVKTIESHRANIRKKLNLNDGTELVHFAIEWAKSG